ncbi:hypothetical protein LEP1GSC202_2545 [Leptospira yanagawae serovar Saopaulo str. Sao Paulo = ATCC 700523]|uniref:Uncharacterized protein n=1 Tax=Leptospira yanagawae serovar Saopaulo str. Sao Paulo = ATCC 700523 TaxID=1249483 RepID=A0A5E8H8U0_9LEPT|nr:hypothetical protein LEP1GSC202_2545 [Leptospira yanagawae serovar Saopaulo str. Sao Paulo = ATCC 700523]
MVNPTNKIPAIKSETLWRILIGIDLTDLEIFVNCFVLVRSEISDKN